MAIDVKICGLSDHQAMDAAIQGGARYVGFMFYPPSPRAVTPEQAIELGETVPPDRIKVGVMVDPDDEQIQQVLPAVDAIQLHGKETPERIRAIKQATGKLIIKSFSLGEPSDLLPLKAFAKVTDMILFDAKPPKSEGNLPGGNGLRFDWRLLDGLTLDRPWLLAGGLDVHNLADAVRLCGAGAVDVSSGVEASLGVKDNAKILDFLRLAAKLQPKASTAT